MFRYWTGTSWTAAVTSDPASPPPLGSSSPGPSAFGGYGAYGAQTSGGYQPQPGGYQSSGAYQPGSSYQPYDQPTAPKKTSIGWIIGLVAVIVAVVLVVVFAIPRLLTPGLTPGGDPTNPNGSNPTATMCPRASDGQATNTNRVENGRVYGGAMSYEMLGDPWSTPSDENRIPYGPPAYSQTIDDQDNPDPSVGGWSSWVSSVVIADLWNGDGFGSTQQAAQIILECVKGTYYGDNTIGQQDTSGASHPVDGHDGYLIDTTFTFDIPNLNATSERALILVVDTGAGSDGTETFSLFYTSVPNTSSQYQADVEQALAGLTVDG